MPTAFEKHSPVDEGAHRQRKTERRRALPPETTDDQPSTFDLERLNAAKPRPTGIGAGPMGENGIDSSMRPRWAWPCTSCSSARRFLLR